MKRNYWIVSILCMLYAAVFVSCQKLAEPRVYGRYVPERKDDFAWENEYAAFRMYGPALRSENPSNGVDLWLKKSPELVVDSFYYREHVLGQPYHINYGKGLDCYKVGHTSGAGGVVVMADDQLWIGGPYDRWQILEQSPEKFVFRLEYDSLLVAGHILQESITITAEAAQPLNKAQVVLTSSHPSSFNSHLYLGGGICVHDSVDSYQMCERCGSVLYAEDALSDKTAAQMNYDYNGSTSQGRAYVAVITPGPSIQRIMDGTLISVQPYQLGDTMTYYFGACWSEWRNGDLAFPADDDWFEATLLYVD
ncbi:MAG: DUF4861 family protein [Paludibacteraceae bacterium]|nr:DUF4861 family protein [Paludibacteraceae bacterium]